ncbi:hypothetical protein [Flavobacterium sp. 140616W15]|uniref:hypothetical protein n=1 Tax=Flavobacterium sp. 140616W15 TaxID=2478552 RepID=UPI000F0C354A|nr:hypothetical protein [Flavobacterium sp. 140616W15]AYN04423.1 hypothetical protein EAG11_09710 [Flavobacterium sp. 140616W15]
MSRSSSSGKYRNSCSLGVKSPRYNRETDVWENTNMLEAMIERRNNQYRSNNPFDVVPYLVTSLTKPELDPIFRKGIFTKALGLTMRDIMKTNTGKNYISQFMKKNDMFYGYKARADGKYSDVILNIVQFELDKDNKIYEGSRGFAHREGNVTLSQDKETGKLLINIYTNQSDIDAISHELFVHNAGGIEEIIQGFRRGGLDEAEKIKRSIYSANEDHIALRDLDSNHKGIRMYKKLLKN